MNPRTTILKGRNGAQALHKRATVDFQNVALALRGSEPMNDSMTTEENCSQSRPPSTAEDNWFDYCERLPFLSDEFMTKFADKLLTLNTGLLAGYLAALKLLTKALNWPLLIPVVLFLISLSCSLWSIFPKKAGGALFDIGAIREHYLLGLRRRRKLISIALASYFVGIVAAITSILWFYG
jgi:hypothetical protein